VLVGDSLGMVVQGQDSTLPVTVDDIVYHVRCVARGLRRALLIADLPFGADATPERALDASLRCLQAGAGMVKLEGAGHKLEVIRFLVEREIPVCAHLGLTPQSVLRLGGYKVQGAKRPPLRACAMTRAWSKKPARRCSSSNACRRRWLPRSPHRCDPHHRHRRRRCLRRQVLVLHDLLGVEHGPSPPEVREGLPRRRRLARRRGAGLRRRVRSGRFPTPRTPTTEDRAIASPTLASLRARVARGSATACASVRADDGQPARGHHSLVELARSMRQVVASVFVNPTQFGPERRFRALPRTPDADAAGLDAPAATCCGCRRVDAMYPYGATARCACACPA
jgi:3-methyl-2-oxobutanoate hydroxymethyltransferase